MISEQFPRLRRDLLRALPFTMALACCSVSARAEVTISDRPTRAMECAKGVCIPKKPRANLNVGDLASMLAAGDVKVVSDSAASDIDFVAPLSWTSTSRLTLDSYRSIYVIQPVTVAGKGALTLSSAQGDNSGVISYIKKGHFTFWDLASKLTLNGATYSLVNSIAMLAHDVAKNPTGNFALANDYDASADGVYSQSPVIVEFDGFAEGLGNTVDHLTIRDKTANDKVGLFAATGGGRGAVSHFRLAHVHVSGGFGAYAGALVGQANGPLFSNSVLGTVSAGDYAYVGGLVGDNESGYLWYDIASVAVSGGHTARAGGLAGYSGAEIYLSSASGSVTVLDGNAGGLGGDVQIVSILMPLGR